MIRMVVEVAGECGLWINNGKRSVLLYNCREGKPDEVGGMKVVSSIFRNREAGFRNFVRIA